MKLFLVLAIALCANAVDVKESEEKAEATQSKDKRQTQDELIHADFVYRAPRKQEQVAPVEEPQEEDKIRSASEAYRPGQVFSLNAQELLDLQPERRAPLGGEHLLQQLYASSPQQEQKQNLQQVYYLEPQQVGRQVSLQPSHAVIARPHFSSNGGEASVGAALSVSDSGASSPRDAFDQELLALLSQSARQEESRQQVYSQSQPIQQTSAPNLAPQQQQQVERYVTKPVKKTTKLRNKAPVSAPQTPAAPQQYLIETTNVQAQQPTLQQYRPLPQPQRPLQSLRYVPIQQPQPAVQQVIYERPEAQGLKIVPAPKLQPLQPLQMQQLQLQQARQPVAYRLVPQYQQPEASPKQYRIIEAPRPQLRQEPRAYAGSAERPVTYLKRYPEPEKMRAVKIYDPVEYVPQQTSQAVGEQYYLRPMYRQSEQRARYELPVPLRPVEQPRPVEATKAPSSAIYVSKNIAPKSVRPKLVRPEQPNQQHQSARFEQPSALEVAGVEQQQSLDEQRAQLPPPRNNKAYTPEEFAALVAAGYSVTPIPVNSHIAQSRSSDVATSKRRPIFRRPQYLPVRDDAP